MEDKGLIFDFGIGNGCDTDFYLSLGFSVVAVDADSHVCSALESRYHTLLGAQLHVVNCIVGIDNSESQSGRFFRNLEFPNLSSAFTSWATRDGGLVEEVHVETRSLESLFDQFGVPYYLKSDIEGSELNLLKELINLNSKPEYLSVEDCRFGPDYLRLMLAMGYRSFSIVDQYEIESRGANSKVSTTKGTSGPFGPWLQTEWVQRDDILDFYFTTVRDEHGVRLAPIGHWFDLHASLGRL